MQVDSGSYKNVEALRNLADDLLGIANTFPDLQDQAVALRARVCEKLRTLDDVPDEESPDDSGDYWEHVFAEAAEDYRRNRY